MLPDLIIGTTLGCLQCSATKKRATQFGLTFATVDLSQPENAEWLDDLKAQGFESAPIVMAPATRETWSGFQQDRLRELGERKVAA